MVCWDEKNDSGKSVSAPGGFLRRPHAYEYMCVKHVAVFEYPALRVQVAGRSTIDESAASEASVEAANDRQTTVCVHATGPTR